MWWGTRYPDELDLEDNGNCMIVETTGRAMRAGNNIEGRLAYSTSDATASSAYTMTSRVLHWTTAFLVLSTMPLGIVAANDWGGSMQDAIYDLHRSIGATIIPLVFLRLIYRWTYPPLPLPDVIPQLQRFAAHTTHWGLYRAFSEQLLSVHRVMGFAIICLVAAHIGAALYHHLVRKDRILLRMVTG